ncbi:MAG: ATP-dependent helicase [Verrucomicrobiota bacterium]
MNLSLEGLNKQQRLAVTSMHGPLLLLAGAGTGKTRVITCRAAYLIANGVKPSNLVLLTFTNKAAREMKERLATLLTQKQAQDVLASTFHSFCAKLLRKYAARLDYSNDFAIAPQGYQNGLIKNILSELGLAEKSKSSGLYKHFISTAKAKLIPPNNDFPENSGWPPMFKEVYTVYQQRLKSMNMIDFDDLLSLTAELWRENDDVLQKCRQQYKYIMVDEYQDTNAAQFELIRLLAGEQKNVCAVGDDDQSIYGWRGAETANIIEFQKWFDNCRIIRLEQNYRSTNKILNAANSVIANNPSRYTKSLWSGKGEGNEVRVIQTEDEQDEAQLIAELLKDLAVDRSNDYGQFAVLYRSNHQSRILEQMLRKHGIPYRLIGSRGFYERREIIDALSLMRTIANPADDLSFLRIVNVPPRGIGDETVKKLRRAQHVTGQTLQQLAHSQEISEKLADQPARNLQWFMELIERYREKFRSPDDFRQCAKDFLDESGYLQGLLKMYKPRKDALQRYDNVIEFLDSMTEPVNAAPERQLTEFLEQFSLLDQNDKEEDHLKDEKNAVSLLTVHAAKGLEFPTVIVSGLEEGLFPHQRALEDNGRAEERRLFYVAMTRAQNELILTYAKRRLAGGKKRWRRQSTFLQEIDSRYLIHNTSEDALTPASPDVAQDYLEQMKEMFT